MTENQYLRWLTQNTQTVYWHDSAIRAGQLEGFFNGATGMTTNPFLIYQTLSSDPGFWRERIAAIPKGLSGDEKVEALTRCVTAFYADEAEPHYDVEKGWGFVCAQTNPSRTGDAAYMIEQAGRLASWAKNVCIKLPATRAGIEAYEECVACGYNVAATVSFTVSQALKAGEARERGKKRAAANGVKPGLGIAVLMIGRLDDYLRDVAHDSAPDVRESDIVQAGVACMKRAYGIFRERGYDTFLMPAAFRTARQVADLAGARMIMSVAPRIAESLLNETALEERIHMPADPDAINRLYTMPEFRRAYEPDGMTPEEFITFGAANRTTGQFIHDGWNPLSEMEYYTAGR